MNNPVNYTDPSGHRKKAKQTRRQNPIQRAVRTVSKTVNKVAKAVKTVVKSAVNHGKAFVKQVMTTGRSSKPSPSPASNRPQRPNPQLQRYYNQTPMPDFGNHLGRRSNLADYTEQRIKSSPTYKAPASYYQAFGSQAVRYQAPVQVPRTSHQATQIYGGYAAQTMYSPLQVAQASGQSTYNWGMSKTREAKNIHKNWTKALEETVRHVCTVAEKVKNDTVKFVKKIDWKKAAVTAGAIGIGIALTVATGGLGAPLAMAIGGAASGAIISGYDAYQSGQRGWALAGSIAKGVVTGGVAGFIGGHFVGAGASLATNLTQNISNQVARQVAKVGIEAGVETAIDTGIDLAVGNKVTGQTAAMNFAYNTFTNGAGSVSTKQAPKAEVNTSKAKAGKLNRTPEVEIQFNRNAKHDANEFNRQLTNQQNGMNKLTVKDYIENRGDYLVNGRSRKGNAVQKSARQEAHQSKLDELVDSGLTYKKAKSEADAWIKTQTALHDPDQVAGGFANSVIGVGEAGVNSSIGSQWKSRIGAVDNVIDELVRTTPYEDLDKIYLNVKLTNLENKMLDNFIKLADMPEIVIKKYGSQVPIELQRIWEEYGLGTFAGGYLKVINPDDYSDLIQNTYFRGDKSIPIFATAFGDVIIYTQNNFIDIIYYRNNDFEVVGKKFSHFLNFIKDEDFQNDYFDITLYKEAVKKYGVLAYQQCFGFTPLLALGGTKNVDKLEKVKILEYLTILTQLTGGVGFD